MHYLITFLEGIISFISPCMLPMIPLYISYFGGNISKGKTLIRSIFFVLGFTIVFSLFGIFAGTIGVFLNDYQKIINVVCGILVIIFGFSYLGIINIPFFKGMKNMQDIKNVFSAFLFGIVFSINLTPCIGAFLGSALMLASTAETVIEGMLLLIIYSAGLGIPFIMSAVLLEKLNTAFLFIKKYYKVINIICALFLIVNGILIMFGIYNVR